MQARRWLLCALLFLAPYSLAQSSSVEQPAPNELKNELKMVIILTRHGVRSPLNLPTKNPWPQNQQDWGVDCCGDLTPSGEQLVRLMGVYYHAYYAKQGLLPSGCPGEQVYIWADNEERTIQTGRELAQGLADGSPGCNLPVQSLEYNPPGCSPSQTDKTCQRAKAGPNDPLFHLPSDFTPDPAQLQAVADDINSRYDKLKAKYLKPLQALQKTLGCPSAPCFLDLPHQASLAPDKRSVQWEGPFNIGSTASEIFLLEYANGLPCNKVGWGKVVFNSPDCSGPGQLFPDMQEIHTAYFQEIQRAPYIAAIQSWQMLLEIILRLDEGRQSRPPEHKLIIFSGHDTIIANVAATLGLHWKLDDLPENDTPPAGALVFELYKDPRKGTYFVRARYVYQMLRQLRTKARLTLDKPPKWVELQFPSCPGKCELQKLQNNVHGAIDKQVASPRSGDK
jgi:4-phytase/acid phosphatase